MAVGKRVEIEDAVKWFSELNNTDVAIAGGKGASLAEMYNSKFPVPPGFVITAQAFDYFITKSGLKEKIKEIISGIEMENTAELDASSAEIRKLVEDSQIPPELEKEILEAYHILGSEKISRMGISETAFNILRNSYEPVFVAVRSSATTEDLGDASFAGQQESFVNTKGDRQLLINVKKCFSSLYTPRAIYYRHKKGFDKVKNLLAVVVQKMVDSEKSGVVFSKDPINKSDNIIVEAVFGLGEGIVSGRINPDNYVVSRDLKIESMKIGEKKIAIVKTGSGDNAIVKLNSEKAKRQVLTNGEIIQIANYAIKLEEHYEKPQDIEFAVEEGKVYIVQSRPITTLKDRKEKSSSLNGKIILEGQGASPGIGIGVVKIIKSMDDLPRIKKGDVLVTEMTNPDMVVAMQKSTAIVTDEGGMTCFGGDTNVLTDKGFITIKEAKDKVRSGEQVNLLAYDSVNMKPVWKRIISAGSRKRNAVRVSVSQTGRIEDNAIDLTPDHKMFTFNNRQLIKEEVSSILNQQKYLCLVDSLPNTPKINNEKLAYLMGALLTDGCVSINMHHTGNPRRGTVTFTQKEIPQKEEFIKRVRTYFEECFSDKLSDGRLKETYGNIRGRLMQGFASDFICCNLNLAIGFTKLSQNIDSWILNLDYNSCLNYLAGIIDGDGCFHNNRIHIYVQKENVLKSIILACLNIGIFPQVTKNRTIHHVQILEKMGEILNFTTRVKCNVNGKLLGNKLFATKQILGDIINKVNYKGRIKPYVQDNLLIDSRKILSYIMPLAEDKIKLELNRVINSGLRMQRVKKISEMGEIEVYNLEIEADNELDHNFVVFTKKYTPLLVSNSHAAIVSREMGIPCVVGTDNATKVLQDGMKITVDGRDGKVYEGEVGESKFVEVNPIIPVKTVKLKLILDLPDFVDRALQSRIEHVGLQRIEGIIAESGKHPLYFEKENKLDEYQNILIDGIGKIAKHFKSVWIRSSDIRSDEFNHLKGAPEKELNPMLGFHGIRFSLKHMGIFETEIEAISKIADKYPEKIFGVMFPQVISIEEVKSAKEVYERFKTDNMNFGVMIETPAAVQIIEDICKEGVEFVSFGTNDLTQFTLAIDRGNDDVQYLYNELHPAIFSQIKKVIETCKRYNVETSICGQAGSKKEMAEFLFKHGISSISVNADAAYDVSVLINQLESDKTNSENYKEDEEKKVENRINENVNKERPAGSENWSKSKWKRWKKRNRKFNENFKQDNGWGKKAMISMAETGSKPGFRRLEETGPIMPIDYKEHIEEKGDELQMEARIEQRHEIEEIKEAEEEIQVEKEIGNSEVNEEFNENQEAYGESSENSEIMEADLSNNEGYYDSSVESAPEEKTMGELLEEDEENGFKNKKKSNSNGFEEYGEYY